MNNIFLIKNILKSTVLLLIFFFFPFYTKINAEWFKHVNNPIIVTNQIPWRYVQNPSIVKKDNSNLMLLEAHNGLHWRITKASSSSDISNWSIYSQSVLPEGWDNENSNPTFIYNDSLNLYQAWFTGFQSSNWKSGPDRYRLGYAYSINGQEWTKYENWVLKGESDKWDSGGLARGLSVLFINGTYHLWYAGTNSDSLEVNPYWRIGYATSPNGTDWTKQNNGNPVIEPTESWELKNVSYPFVLHEDGTYKMWYATGDGDGMTRYVYATSSDGIHWDKPADKNPVFSATGNTADFDGKNLSGHMIMREGDIYKMWYSGFNGSRWSIGYATSAADIATPTPTPTPIEPVVIVPGFLGSWNKDAILHGQKNPSTPWNIPSFVKEYGGIIQTLKNLGYEEGKTLFVWPYDWRKTVESITISFDTFLTNTVKPQNPNSKIHIIGHSLGGLVGRTWAQKEQHKDQIHHLVTIATPHKGALQAYKPWEGGDIHGDNTLWNIGLWILVQRTRHSLAPTREVIQENYPIIGNLLPSEPYLKRENGTFLTNNDMNVWNSWLTNLNVDVPSVYPILDAIKGSGFSNTPLSYVVKPPSWLDKALGNWTDGKPVSTETADGDNFIPGQREVFPDDPSFTVQQSHGNTIASIEGITSILTRLEIPFTNDKLVPGQETKITPGIIFFILSPATFRVTYNNQTYEENEGILFIPNATSGTYTATITGTGTGMYSFHVGQMTEEKIIWTEYTDSITPGKQKTYQFYIDIAHPKADPVTNIALDKRLQQIDEQLERIHHRPFSPFIIKARLDIHTAQRFLAKKHYIGVKEQLEQLLFDLSLVRRFQKNKTLIEQTYAISYMGIDAFAQLQPQASKIGINEKIIKRMISITTDLEQKVGKDLEKKAKRNMLSKTDALCFEQAIAYKTRALETPTDASARIYILLFQSQLLFGESK